MFHRALDGCEPLLDPAVEIIGETFVGAARAGLVRRPVDDDLAGVELSVVGRPRGQILRDEDRV